MFIFSFTYSTFVFFIPEPSTVRYYSSFRLWFLSHTQVHPVRRHYQRKRMPSPHMQHSRRTLHQESTLHQDTSCRNYLKVHIERMKHILIHSLRNSHVMYTTIRFEVRAKAFSSSTCCEGTPSKVCWAIPSYIFAAVKRHTVIRY